MSHRKINNTMRFLQQIVSVQRSWCQEHTISRRRSHTLLAFGWPFYLFWLPSGGELSAKPTEGRQAPLVQRIVIERIGGELFGVRLHGVVLVADVLALVQREFRQTHTVLGREGLQEVGLVVVERSGVVAVEVATHRPLYGASAFSPMDSTRPSSER